MCISVHMGARRAHSHARQNMNTADSTHMYGIVLSSVLLVAFTSSSVAKKFGFSKNDNSDPAPLSEISALNYARNPGCHCLYTFTSFEYDGETEYTSSTPWNACYDFEEQCQSVWKNPDTLNNGRAPATGVYVAPAEDNRDVAGDEPASTIVSCANEFGCLRVESNVVMPTSATGKEYWSYPVDIIEREFVKSVGIDVQLPTSKSKTAHRRAVRKAVCKCNMGFTSPLQLESSWCGAECPGPDCALGSTYDERTEEWCDDIQLTTEDTAKNGKCRIVNFTGKFRLPAYMENRDSDVYPGPFVPQFIQPEAANLDDFESFATSTHNARLNAPLAVHNARMNTHSMNDFKADPVISVRRDAYNYYTPSSRYAESAKYDDVARNLFNVLAAPLSEEATQTSGSNSFSRMSAKQRHASRVRLKRFACR